MQVVTLAAAVVADKNTDVELPSAYSDHAEALLQIEISGTFTVTIKGKLHADASYVELVPATTVNLLQPVAFMPFLRIVTSGGASTPICSVYAMCSDHVRQ